MAPSSFQLITITATLTTFVLKRYLGCSWWYAVPIFIAFFITWNAYRILIYERYLSPLARLPGPKVALARNNTDIRDIGSWENFLQFGMRNPVKHIFGGFANTEILLVSSPTLASSTPVESCQRRLLLFNTC
jgi:hypothetical protein